MALQELSVEKQVVKVSLPEVASLAGEMLLGFVDTFWVSRLGTPAVAAISASTYLLWIIYSLVDIVAVGVVGLSAFYHGRGDRKGLGRVFYTAFYSINLLSFLLAGLLLFNLSGYISFFNVTLKAKIWMGDYLAVQLVFLPVGALYYLVSSVYEGQGKTAKVFRSSLLVLFANAVLDPLLIFSLGLELKGAALASVISRTLGLFYLWSGLKLPKEGFSLRCLSKILSIGTPSSVYWLSSTGVFLYINGLASRIEPASVAAMGVGIRYETIPYIIAMGISVGASAVVGKSRGRRDQEGLRRASLFSLKIMLWVSIALGLVFFALAPQLSALFLRGKAREIAVLYLRISAFSQVFFSLSVVFEGIFVGMGRTFPALALAMLVVLSRVPLSYLFPSLLWIFLIFPLTNFLIDLTFLFFYRLYIKASL